MLTVRRPRGRPRDPHADGRILTAAAELIMRVGFEAMTVDAVAAKAGVGKATVYRRWAKKEDLGVAAMQGLYQSRMPVPDTGSIRGDLRETYASAIEFARSEDGTAYLRASIGESVRDTRIAHMYRLAVSQAESVGRDIFRRAIDRGEVRPDIDLDVIVQLFAGVIILRAITRQDLPSDVELERLIDLVVSGAA